jgi:hypothetical protein
VLCKYVLTCLALVESLTAQTQPTQSMRWRVAAHARGTMPDDLRKCSGCCVKGKVGGGCV